MYFLEGTKEFFIQNGALGLFILSFSEASFFPIPPDIVLLPLALISPEKALYYAAITSIASTLGGVFGYLIGKRAGRPILARFIKEENFHKIEDMFSRYGGWAVAVAGFTPIPYKVFTIASGVFGMNFTTFFIATVLSRSARFFLEGAFVLALGENAIAYIDRFLGPGSFVLLAIMGLLYFLIQKSGISISVTLREGTLAHIFKQKLKTFYGEFSIYLIAGFSIAATFGILFFKMATEVLEKEVEDFDIGIIGYISQINLNSIDFISHLLDIIEKPLIFAIIILLYLLYINYLYKKNIYSGMALVTFIGSFLLQWGFKSFYKRPRLPNVDATSFFAYSFPSGFMVILTALLGYMAFLLLKNKNKAKKLIIIFGWISIMLMVGISRIHAGISYPSDVLAGFWLGGLWLAICIVATKALEYYR
ncbi:VTT domain-containing protein [Tepidanaerobacter sp. GT38]|uniref:VTT domain-containing protein n=1 Tax=Tepidanaerobacter sp. GT38 TaxID=2722793 RepID=UPI001F20378E|nr:VTT domain-containing protein [Tepidanaerobacter sp. GT38]